VPESGFKYKKQRYKYRKQRYFASLEFDVFRVQLKFAFRIRSSVYIQILVFYHCPSYNCGA